MFSAEPHLLLFRRQHPPLSSPGTAMGTVEGGVDTYRWGNWTWGIEWYWPVVYLGESGKEAEWLSGHDLQVICNGGWMEHRVMDTGLLSRISAD